jgi:Kdo2-lipid IVA lauroyltransferase/acyltransferase
MATFSDRVITLLLLTAGYISGMLSRRARQSVGRMLGTLLRLLSAKRARITLRQIEDALPKLSSNRHQSICKAAYHNLGIVLAELIAFPHLSNEDMRFLARFENKRLIENCYEKGRPVIIVSAHYGNWEVMAASYPLHHSQAGLVVVFPQYNSTADTILNQYRIQTGNDIIQMSGAARAMIQRLRSGGTVAMLADQNALPEHGIVMDFLGKPASVYEAPASLALRYNAALITGFCEREYDGHYVLRWEEIDHSDLTFSPEGIRELTRRHVARLEEQIRDTPELWAWQHRRWKV